MSNTFCHCCGKTLGKPHENYSILHEAVAMLAVLWRWPVGYRMGFCGMPRRRTQDAGRGKFLLWQCFCLYLIVRSDPCRYSTLRFASLDA